MRANRLVFLVVLVASSSILVFISSSNGPAFLGHLGASTHRLSFGSNGLGTTGVLIPSYTLVSTSYDANHTLSGFVVGTLYVFPYRLMPDTKISLGLYLNGRLAATRDYGPSYNYHIPATILGVAQSDEANFTDSILALSVSDGLSNPAPSGTTVTLAAWSNNPIWVQIDRSSPTHSYETSGVVAYSAASTISVGTGHIAHYTLSVSFESQ